jgi:hypothetical protein
MVVGLIKANTPPHLEGGLQRVNPPFLVSIGLKSRFIDLNNYEKVFMKIALSF